MAKLTIKITQTGEEFEIEDVDLSQLTPRQLIDEMINHGLLLAESIAPYGIIDKNGLKVDGEDLCSTFAKLGFVDGDTVRIIMRASGGGGEGKIPASIKFFSTFIPQPRKERQRSKQEPDESDNYSGGALAGAAIGAGGILLGGLLGGIIGGVAGAVGGHFWDNHKEWYDEERQTTANLSDINEVYSSIFAPAEVKPKSHMLVQVYLHLYEETEKVKALAQESDKDAERRDYIPLQCKLKKGDKVDVQLNIYGETLMMSDKKSVVWQGSFTKCSFDYVVPKDIDVDELSCVAMLAVNGVPVGEMRFITRIVDAPRQQNPEIIAHKYNKVFISYSHQDESKVKFLHEGLELSAVPHFFDRKYLKAGDVFPQVIQDYINSADLFILCWSENASKSEYVQKERLQALERAFPQVKPEQEAKLRIYPMSIEPRTELPGDMKENYHFGEM